VVHSFGTKKRLFDEVIDPPVDPATLRARLTKRIGRLGQQKIGVVVQPEPRSRQAGHVADVIGPARGDEAADSAQQSTERWHTA
jgi:hypothetical protein